MVNRTLDGSRLGLSAAHPERVFHFLFPDTDAAASAVLGDLTG